MLFRSQVLGPRLWWRACRQGLATLLHKWPCELQRAQTTLRPASSHQTATLLTFNRNHTFHLDKAWLPGCLTALTVVYTLDTLTPFLQIKHVTYPQPYANLDTVDSELEKKITAGWIINDHIKKEDFSVHCSFDDDA